MSSYSSSNEWLLCLFVLNGICTPALVRLSVHRLAVPAIGGSLFAPFFIPLCGIIDLASSGWLGAGGGYCFKKSYFELFIVFSDIFLSKYNIH
jgi:hypothetical protein